MFYRTPDLAPAGETGARGVLPPLGKGKARGKRRPREGAKAGRRQPNHTLPRNSPQDGYISGVATARYNGPVVGGLGCSCGARAGLTT
jgi:hypothetical protein